MIAALLVAAALAFVPRPDVPPPTARFKAGPVKCAYYVVSARGIFCARYVPGRQDPRLVLRVTVVPK